MPKRRSAQLIRFRPRPADLLRLIRRLTAEGRIGYLDHAAIERMPERSFDVFDVEEVLTNGIIQGPIDPGVNVGEWKVKLVAPLDWTTRRMGVVVIVVREIKLLIKTTEWERI